MRTKQKIQTMLFDTVLPKGCIEINLVLQEILNTINKNSHLLTLIHKDLCAGLKNPKTGRQGLSAKQILGCNVIKFRENLSYERARNLIADSISLRILMDFGFSSTVPSKKAFMDATNRLSVETIQKINELLIHFAQKEGIEEGKKFARIQHQ